MHDIDQAYNFKGRYQEGAQGFAERDADAEELEAGCQARPEALEKCNDKNSQQPGPRWRLPHRPQMRLECPPATPVHSKKIKISQNFKNLNLKISHII